MNIIILCYLLTGPRKADSVLDHPSSRFRHCNCFFTRLDTQFPVFSLYFKFTKIHGPAIARRAYIIPIQKSWLLDFKTPERNKVSIT